MKITSRASDYALLLLIHLSGNPQNDVVSVKSIAESLNISLRFLANIANKLAIARIVVSHRGNGGGIRLARAGEAIHIREVIEAIEGPVQTMFCQNTQELCTHELTCQMKHFWDDVQEDIMHKLDTTTIADLASPGRGKVKLAHLRSYREGIALPVAPKGLNS